MINPSVTQVLDRTQYPVLLNSGCRRQSTVLLRHRAVKQAIVTMRTRFMETLTLPEIADSAQLSPFHFNRIFRSMIGIPPSVFLAAIRMEAAKRLLLTTQRSVTDVCFDVGYNSMGTFTTRFTLFVGLPPSRFRQLAQEKIIHICPQNLGDTLARIQRMRHISEQPTITGTLTVPPSFEGLIFVGLFTDPLPQGKPVGCTVVSSSGQYNIPTVPDGRYYLFAAAMEQSQDFFTLLTEGARLNSGLGIPPITIHHGRVHGSTDISLEPVSWADPPIVVAFPWLFMTYFLQYMGSLAEIG